MPRAVVIPEIESPKIYAAISAVMEEVEHIAKNRQGDNIRYKFRGIDDVYHALHSLLAKHKVFTVPQVLEERSEERTTKSGGHMIYRILRIKYIFYTVDGSFIECVVVGEAMDTSDKASNKAMSVAHKYALIQVFAIPTAEDKDPEVNDHQVGPKVQAPGPKRPATPAPQPAGFNKENPIQVEYMRGFLNKRGITSPNEQKLIFSMLHNRPGRDIAKVLKELDYPDVPVPPVSAEVMEQPPFDPSEQHYVPE